MSQADSAPLSSSEGEAAPSFDARLARLEKIVSALEKGDMELESAIECYKEGVVLLRACRGLLEGFRAQVEELTREAEGGSVPYGDDPDVRG